MLDHERRVLSHLVLVDGFSRRNAEIALEWYREGELTYPEKVVIERILLEPENDDLPIVRIKDSNPVMWVASHLNYRITMAGGDARTRSRIRG